MTTIPQHQERQHRPIESLSMAVPLPGNVRAALRVSYALRRVPEGSFHSLLPTPSSPQVGDIALARVESIGRHEALDGRDGRRGKLHKGDPIAVVFGNRYATLQFEGYAAADGDHCHLLSGGGLCGLVESKHDAVPEPTTLRLEGALGDAQGLPLRLQNFALAPWPSGGHERPRVVVIVGTAMDSGKTYTARSLILGLRREGVRVGSIKLTGTASGRDTFTMLDAGACVTLDFLDGGLPSTYLAPLAELLDIHHLLVDHCAAHDAACVVIEIADGILQSETAALLRSTRFTSTVHAWLLAASDALGAAGAVHVLRGLGIAPLAVSGIVSRSALGRREVEAATKIPCLAAVQVEEGALNAELVGAPPAGGIDARSAEEPALTC